VILLIACIVIPSFCTDLPYLYRVYISLATFAILHNMMFSDHIHHFDSALAITTAIWTYLGEFLRWLIRHLVLEYAGGRQLGFQELSPFHVLPPCTFHGRDASALAEGRGRLQNPEEI